MTAWNLDRVRMLYQVRGDEPAEQLEEIRRAEQLGFDVAVVPDHVGHLASPVPLLSAAAAVTERIRLGTMVLNNEMRNPVQLAWDIATLDRVAEGRVELGLGAGHTPQEFAATGIERRSGRERKARLAEAVEIIGPLLAGSTVDFEGEHYTVRTASILPAVQRPLPILVGGNGRELLEHAARHADLIGLQGLGRTLADGHAHTVDWRPAHLDAQVDTITTAAAGRATPPRLSALVQVAAVTDDPAAVLDPILDRVDGLNRADADEIPYLLVGTVDQILAKIERIQARWGIADLVVRELDGFATVVEALR
ncbi:MAG: TIGR03621 family F420-dependent LLM class oxidoreductase [Actinomycetota bacterium]